ncbi:MAG: hypothetical protein WC806_03395 [Candidatus Gracilibacteria bacterium]|jgi:uncharacterized protein YjeT (DUF2065 family)
MTPKFLLISLSIYIFILIIPGLINPNYFRKSYKKLYSESEYVRILAMFALLFGFLFLSVNYIPTKNISAIIPIFGYLMVLKGIILFWFPNVAKTKIKFLFASDRTTALWCLLALAVGLALLYVAVNLIA